MRDRALGSTIRLKFTTTDANGAPVAPSSAFVAADFRIYKDGSASEKTSTNGITVTSPFDSVVGRHLIEIDTSNATGDVGFWASGSAYFVELNTAKTVNSQTVSGLEIGSFSIELQTADTRKFSGSAVIQSGGRPEVKVDNIAANAVTASALATDAVAEIADAVWDEPYADHTTSTSYGGRVVRAVNSNVTVQITGSNHIAADVHAFQTDVIDAAALAASAVTEIQSGLATEANQTTILARLGAWTGSGINTILGAFRALAGKAAALTPTDISTGTTYNNTTDSLEAIRDRGDAAWVSSASTGTGARTVTITVDDGTTALQNAKVRISEGVNTFIGLTNASGVVTFNLDDATYTVSITKSGYTYAGTTIIVDGTETRTYSMSAVVIPSPSNPALCAVTIPILDQYGAELADEVVEIRFNEFDVGANTVALVLSPPPTLTSDSNGLVQVDLLREAKYSVFYGQDDYKRRLDFTVPDAGSYTVGE